MIGTNSLVTREINQLPLTQDNNRQNQSVETKIVKWPLFGYV